MAKPELGTKRICPETGRKFYDLNRDPIVSPYTGISYPRSYFETATESQVEDEEELDQKPLDDDDAADMVPLDDDSDDDVIPADDDVIPDLGDDEVDLGDDDDTFLEDEEDEDDVTGIIGVSNEDDER
ncbi:TIGR02300 family protein [Chelativorans composti]|uniref:TIGR02300 family protein n=1 Tax=Chelativorans composti TaxID=768533 RepID=A0ABW5DFZ3_9HYPH